MKQTQWMIALVMLAVMVFGITFTMNYIGGGASPTITSGTTTGPTNEVIFFERAFPFDPREPDKRPYLLQEEHSRGHYDYWFYNPNTVAVILGLERTSCKCAGAEIHLPDSKAVAQLPGAFAAEVAALAIQPLLGVGMHAQLLEAIQTGAKRYEVMNRTEKVSIAPGALGWLRLAWKGDRGGKQNQFARVWMDDSNTGKTATLEIFLNFIEPLRVRPTLDIGTIRDEDLVKGLSRFMICWSSTRDHLDLQVRPAVERLGGASGDPFVLGKPEPLSAVECRQLAVENEAQGGETFAGLVRCAYRIPLTLQQRSPDGKTPFDVGPFRRRFLISSPDADNISSVLVNGRVSGLVEIGLGDEGGEIHFYTFPRKRGKREKIFLQSDAADLTLEFDRERTPEYLDAKLIPDATAGRQSWQLEVQVLPDKASGPFPRRNDPAYEDAAVYLRALLPGKPPRPIRIAVNGTASEG